MEYEDSYEHMVDEARGENKRLRARITALEAERDDLRDEVNKRVITLRELYAERDELLIDGQIALSNLADIQTENARLRADLARQHDAEKRRALVPLSSVYEEHCRQLEQRNDVLTADNQNLTERVRQLDAENHTLQNALMAERLGKYAPADATQQPGGLSPLSAGQGEG
jgi:cell division protein FtsB